MSDDLICRCRRTIRREESFIFGDVESFQELVVTDPMTHIGSDVERLEGIVGQTSVAVVTFDGKFSPGPPVFGNSEY